MTKLHLLDEGSERVPSNELSHPQATCVETSGRSFRQKLMFAASASMMSLAAPISGLYGGRAMAQALPAGCVDTNPSDPTNANAGNGNVDNDETIDCVSNPAGTAIETITIQGSRLTLNVGDGATETVVNPSVGPDRAVYVNVADDTTINVRENATIDGEAEFGLKGFAFGGDMTVSGHLDGSAPTGQSGIKGDKGGIYFYVYSSSSVSVTDLSYVAGGTSIGENAIEITTQFGDIEVKNIESVHSEAGAAINAYARYNGASISIQNVAIPKFDHDEMAGTEDIASHSGIVAKTGSGRINIGFGDLNDATDDAASAIGNIYAETGNGIYANTSNGNIDVLVTGNIDAGDTGIETISQFGAISVTANGSVIGDNAGIFADTSSAADMSLTTTGAVSGFSNGILLRQNGTGSIDATVNDVTATSGTAITIQALGNSVKQELNVDGAVSGSSTGVFIDHSGSGASVLKLGAGASIEGEALDGVRIGSALAEGATILVQGASGTITGGNRGLSLDTNNGDITVEDLTSVEGGIGNGISAKSRGGQITIQDIDRVVGGGSIAIDVDTRLSDESGGNDISIQNIARVDGIQAYSGTGDINIGFGDLNDATDDAASAIGDIFTQNKGIYASSQGGDIHIYVDGTPLRSTIMAAVEQVLTCWM